MYMKGRLCRYLSGLALMLFCFVFLSQAQNVSGTLTGTVADQSGAVVPGAKVTMKNQVSGDERASVSKPVLYQHFPGNRDLYLPLLDQRVDEPVETVREALRSTSYNKHRVAATFSAYFEYVERQGQAYRLVFESDLGNEEAVRDRLERGQRECAEMISPMIRQDAGLDDAEAHLVSVAMVGLAQVTARYWLSTTLSTTRQCIPREAAEQLVARLAWRGISGWPRN